MSDMDTGVQREGLWARLLSALRVAQFRWIWLGVGIAGSGMYAVLVVSGAEAARLAHSPLVTSVVFAVILGPSLIVGPIAGASADRRNRALVMVTGVCVAAAGGLALAVISLGGLGSVPLLIAGTALVGCGQAILMPAWQAMLPGILGERLLNGSAYMRIASQGGQFLGAAIITPVLIGSGATAGFAVATVFYLIALVFVLLIRVPMVRVERDRAGIREGYRYLRHRRPLAALIFFVACHCTFTMAFVGLLPSFAGHSLGNPDDYGALVSAVGLGAIGGAVVLIVMAERLDSARALWVTGLLSGFALVWLGASTSAVMAAAAAIAVGASQGFFMAVMYSVTLGITSEDMRARISSFSTIFTAGSMSVFSLAWGALAQVIPSGIVMMATGTVFLILLAGFIVWWLPQLRVNKGLQTSTINAVPQTF